MGGRVEVTRVDIPLSTEPELHHDGETGRARLERRLRPLSLGLGPSTYLGPRMDRDCERSTHRTIHRKSERSGVTIGVFLPQSCLTVPSGDTPTR